MNLRHTIFPLLLSFLAGGLSAEEIKPPDNVAKLSYGQMIKQGEKLIFAPCRDRSYALLEDVSEDKKLTKALALIGLEQGKKLYVELKGVLEGGVLKASELNLAHTDGRCQQPGSKDEAWRAAGNEPGWMLAAGGAELLLKRQGKPNLLLPYNGFKSVGPLQVYEVTEDGQTLSVRIEPTLCRDTMAESVFGWSASVTINSETLKGCAWQR